MWNKNAIVSLEQRYDYVKDNYFNIVFTISGISTICNVGTLTTSELIYLNKKLLFRHIIIKCMFLIPGTRLGEYLPINSHSDSEISPCGSVNQLYWSVSKGNSQDY